MITADMEIDQTGAIVLVGSASWSTQTEDIPRRGWIARYSPMP